MVSRTKTNKEVKTKVGNANGPYEDVLTSVKRLKLSWIGQARETNKADRENDGKTLSENGLALNGTSYCGKVRSGGSWF